MERTRSQWERGKGEGGRMGEKIGRLKEGKDKVSSHAEDSCHFSGKMHSGFLRLKDKTTEGCVFISSITKAATDFKGEHSFSPS